jgi:hypothetical protein
MMETSSTELKLHVFVGGRSSNNAKAIPVAIGEVAKKFSNKYRFLVTYFDVEDVKNNRFTLVEFAQWLADSDIYLIVNHPAQALNERQSPEEGAW